MDKKWSDYNGYFVSDDSFLFSITNKKKYPSVNKSNTGYYDTTTYGPCWGGDLWVNPGAFSGYAGSSAYGANYEELVGTSSFQCEEYEIFELK